MIAHSLLLRLLTSRSKLAKIWKTKINKKPHQPILRNKRYYDATWYHLRFEEVKEWWRWLLWTEIGRKLMPMAMWRKYAGNRNLSGDRSHNSCSKTTFPVCINNRWYYPFSVLLNAVSTKALPVSFYGLMGEVAPRATC